MNMGCHQLGSGGRTQMSSNPAKQNANGNELPSTYVAQDGRIQISSNPAKPSAQGHELPPKQNGKALPPMFFNNQKEDEDSSDGGEIPVMRWST